MLIVYLPYATSVLAIVLSQSSAAHLTGVAVRVASQPKMQRAKAGHRSDYPPHANRSRIAMVRNRVRACIAMPSEHDHGKRGLPTCGRAPTVEGRYDRASMRTIAPRPRCSDRRADHSQVLMPLMGQRLTRDFTLLVCSCDMGIGTNRFRTASWIGPMPGFGRSDCSGGDHARSAKCVRHERENRRRQEGDRVAASSADRQPRIVYLRGVGQDRLQFPVDFLPSAETDSDGLQCTLSY